MFKIVSDSSSDLLELSGIPYATVPLKISTAEKEFVDDSSLDISEMLEYLEAYRGKSGSSCPSVGEWLEAFGDADAIFCVTITSGLSGSYNSASVAAKQYMEEHEGTRVYVVDSLSTGAESALLIEKIRDMIIAGLPFDEIVADIQQYSTHTHLLFALESLRNLANNGRVNPLVAKLAGLIGIRVVGCASEQGTLEILEKVRGAVRTVDALLAQMQANGYAGGAVRIHHCQNLGLAQVLADKIRALHQDAKIVISQTRALCSFYAERGGLLIGYEDDAQSP